VNAEPRLRRGTVADADIAAEVYLNAIGFRAKRLSVDPVSGCAV
jgi:hypothetical protein